MESKKTQNVVTDVTKSPLKRYQQIIVGDTSITFTIKYEIILGLLENFPGAMGLWLRGKFYSSILQAIGRGVVIGKGSRFHYPRKIVLGNRVAIAYDCLFDARGESDVGIKIGDDVIIGRNSSMVCKDGEIQIGDKVGIGANSTISAVAGNIVTVGNNVLIAPRCYFGGISYQTKSIDNAIVSQGLTPKGGIQVGRNSWIGVNVTILDGVTVGRDAIIAAGAVVTKDVPPFGVAMGVPAKIIRVRKGELS